LLIVPKKLEKIKMLKLESKANVLRLKSFKWSLKYTISTLMISLVISGFVSNAYATCTSTISNSSSNSTTNLIATADNQCLTNSGTLTGSIQSYYSGSISTNTGILNGSISGFRNNSIIINNGTINMQRLGTAVYAGDGDFTSIINTGNIIANISEGNDLYAIWLVNEGVVSSLINSGIIRMDGAGQTVAIFNYAGNTITNLTNSGQISVAGNYAAIANNSVITTLNNSGSIINTGDGHGITNNPSSSIVTINNTGSISALASGKVGIRNNSGATIGALNNAQGGNGLSATTTALTYDGVLPTNYNIIINSASNYGQLAVTSPSGATSFGIYESSLITSRLYTGVLQGLETGNLGGTRTGTYDNMNWTLALQSGSLTTWDLSFTGTSLAQTQSSLASHARKLSGTLNIASLISNFPNSNTYDCNLFDVKGMCISAGGRYSTVDNPSSNSTAAVVTLGYKVSPSIRIGGFLDQSVNNNNPTGVHLSNSNPMMGAFAYWNQNADGLGYQIKLANAYQDKDLSTTRDVIGTSEAGRGTTSLTTQSYVGELSYAFMYKENTLVRPYFALRHTSIEQDAYTETGVTAPLTYSAINNRTTSALMGVKFKHALNEKTNLIGSLGVEQDLHNKTDRLTATGIAGLTSENLSSDLHRTRPVASIGATYDIAKTQRLSGEVLVQQLPFQSTAGATAYVNYMIGF